jgi:hypothetical protein
LPNIKQFVPGPALRCVFEPGPKERPDKSYKEIEPCEQLSLLITRKASKSLAIYLIRP